MWDWLIHEIEVQRIQWMLIWFFLVSDTMRIYILQLKVGRMQNRGTP